MKKLIIISVVFALVAGVAFAQVSGSVETRFTLFDVELDFDDLPAAVPNTYGGIGAAHIQLEGSNEDGTLGGLFRLRNTDIVRSSPWFHRVFVWWKPIPQIRVFLGIDNDGMFDTADFLGWSFHSGDNDYLFFHHWDWWRQIFPGNWDGFGLALSFYPVDGLNLNLVIPTGGMNWPQATADQVERKVNVRQMYPWGLRLQGSYAIDGIGKVQFAYNLQDKEADSDHFAGSNDYSDGGEKATRESDHFGRFGLSFVLTAIDNMNIMLGGSVLIPRDGADAVIHFGGGATFTGEGWGVKGRFGLRSGKTNTYKVKETYLNPDFIFREEEREVDTEYGDLFINANVMPYFNLGPGTLMVDVGISAQVNSAHKEKLESEEKKAVGFFLAPVYRLPIPGGAFRVGLNVSSNISGNGNISLKNSDKIDIKVPLLLSFGF